jgi:hypothetical protein
MIKIAPPLEFPRRRSRPRRQFGPPPATSLTLVAASFQYVGPGAALTLQFDRAISLDGFNPSQITVQDPSGTGFAYVGTGVVDTPDAQTVVVEMGQTGSAVGTLDVLSATGATGIVAVDDEATWPGVTGLGLPYP